MHNKFISVLGFISLLAISNAFAARPDNLQPIPEPPPPPNQLQSGEAIPLGEPQVTIIQRGNNTIREYRLNGHLYAVKVTPDHGVPYYLVDADGDGYMEGQFYDSTSGKIIAPQWVLHRW